MLDRSVRHDDRHEHQFNYLPRQLLLPTCATIGHNCYEVPPTGDSSATEIRPGKGTVGVPRAIADDQRERPQAERIRREKYDRDYAVIQIITPDQLRRDENCPEHQPQCRRFFGRLT